MTTDEELEQLRADNTVLYEALLRQDEELEQSRQANTELREGLTRAIETIKLLQEQAKQVQGQVDGGPRASQNAPGAASQR